MRFHAQPFSTTVLLLGLGTWYSGLASGQSATERPYRIVKGHSQDVKSLSWSPDGAKLASGARDGTVRIWDAAAVIELRVLRCPSPDVSEVAWSPDGSHLAAVTNGEVLLWDADSGREIRVMNTSPTSPRASATYGPNFVAAHWSPDGRLLAVDGWIDGTVRLIDTKTGEEAKRLQVATAGASASIGWSPKGDYVASSARNERVIRVWNSATWQEVTTLGGLLKDANALAWSPDGTWISSYGLGAEITVSHFREKQVQVLRQVVREQQLPEWLRPYWQYAMNVTTMTWSRDGRYLAVNTQATIASLWDTRNWKEAQQLHGIRSMTWNPDGKQFAALTGEMLSVWSSRRSANNGSANSPTT